MEQNFFDNETVFKGYCELRDSESNCNTLMEQPEMAKLLPELGGKRVLDLGCGFGHNCMDFIRRGAAAVTGIDISHKMLEVARCESDHPDIDYRCMSMTEISSLEGGYDLIYSSLAVHYIEDMPKLMRDISALLNGGGTLLFSQEHPIYTASENGQGHYILDEQGNKSGYCFSHYLASGRREDEWFIKGRIYYHRTFSDVVNAVADAGFVVQQVCEPVPDDNMIAKRPRSDVLHKPLFLIIKAIKPFDTDITERT